MDYGDYFKTGSIYIYNFTTLTLLLKFDKCRPKHQTQCQHIFLESAYLPQGHNLQKKNTRNVWTTIITDQVYLIIIKQVNNIGKTVIKYF